MKTIILDLCGGTGAWSRPYGDAGYPVIKITLPEYDILKAYTDDVSIHFPHIEQSETIVPFEKIYGILAAPPCTMFSYARTNAKKPRDLKGAMEIVQACLRIIWAVQASESSGKKVGLQFWALENPFGFLRYFLGKPALIYSPTDYGDRYQKKTCLWGHFNEPRKNPIELTKEEKFKFGRHSQALPLLPKEYKSGDYNRRAAARAITPPMFAQAFYKANL